MLSVSTAAVHRTMTIKPLDASPSPPGHGSKTRRSWNCEFRGFAKRQSRPNAARKLISEKNNDANIGIDVRCQTVCFQQPSTDSDKDRVSHELFVDCEEKSEQKTAEEPVQNNSTDSQSNSQKNHEKTKSLRSIPFLKSALMQHSKVWRLKKIQMNSNDENEDSSKSKEDVQSFGIFEDVTTTGINDKEDITPETKNQKLDTEKLENIDNKQQKTVPNGHSLKPLENTSISGLSNEFSVTGISEKHETTTKNDKSSKNYEIDEIYRDFNMYKVNINTDIDDKTKKHDCVSENMNKVESKEENDGKPIVKEDSVKNKNTSTLDTFDIKKCSSKMSLALNFLESKSPTVNDKAESTNNTPDLSVYTISQEPEPITTSYVNFEGANPWELDAELGILADTWNNEPENRLLLHSTSSKNYAFKEFNEKPIPYNPTFNDNNGSSNKKDEDFEIQEVNFENSKFFRGFPNPPGENCCWLNATLHALFGLPLLNHLIEMQTEYNLQECSELTQTLITLYLYWTKGERQKMNQSLKFFKENLRILDESYVSQYQQDVSEFLMIFLNYLKSDFDKILLKKNEETYSQDKNVSEMENIPENRQNYRESPRSPQTPSKRRPLQDISPLKRKSSDSNSDISNETSPKIRKIDFTFSAKDLSSPRGNGNSVTNDPSYRVHTPPQFTKNDVKTMKETTVPKNPVDRYFLLKMMEHYVCLSCGKNRQRKIDNLMIYVDLPSESATKCAVALEEAIAKSLGSEERVLTCGKCKHDKHKASMSFRAIPRVLMVQVNRYGLSEDGSVGKFNTAVEIPHALRLNLNFSNSENGNEIIEDFEPVCIISHVGSAMDCGHYTSYVRHGESWYHFNDLSVNEVSRHEALVAAETTAYLVFFVNSRIYNRDLNFV